MISNNQIVIVSKTSLNEKGQMYGILGIINNITIINQQFMLSTMNQQQKKRPSKLIEIILKTIHYHLLMLCLGLSILSLNYF